MEGDLETLGSEEDVFVHHLVPFSISMCFKSNFTTDLGANPGTFHGVGPDTSASSRSIPSVPLSEQPQLP